MKGIRKTGRVGVCLWCGAHVEEDEDQAGEGPGRFDWGIDGDYGCGESPMTDPEEGTGGHATIEDVRRYCVIADAALFVLSTAELWPKAMGANLRTAMRQLQRAAVHPSRPDNRPRVAI